MLVVFNEMGERKTDFKSLMVFLTCAFLSHPTCLIFTDYVGSNEIKGLLLKLPYNQGFVTVLVNQNSSFCLLLSNPYLFLSFCLLM